MIMQRLSVCPDVYTLNILKYNIGIKFWVRDFIRIYLKQIYILKSAAINKKIQYIKYTWYKYKNYLWNTATRFGLMAVFRDITYYNKTISLSRTRRYHLVQQEDEVSLKQGGGISYEISVTVVSLWFLNVSLQTRSYSTWTPFTALQQRSTNYG